MDKYCIVNICIISFHSPTSLKESVKRDISIIQSHTVCCVLWRRSSLTLQSVAGLQLVNSPTHRHTRIYAQYSIAQWIPTRVVSQTSYKTVQFHSFLRYEKSIRNVTSVTEVRSASPRLLLVHGTPWWVLLQHCIMLRLFFIVKCGIACFLCVMSIFDIRASSSSPRLLVPNFVSFMTSIAQLKHGEKITYSINHSITHLTYLMTREPKQNTSKKHILWGI